MDEPRNSTSVWMVVSDEIYSYYGPTKQLFVFPRPDPAKIDHEPAKVANRGFFYSLGRFWAGNLSNLLQPDGPILFLTVRPELAKARFRIERLPDRPGQFLLKFTPLEQRDADEFSQALIALNTTTLLPDTVRLLSPNGKDTKTFVFTKIETNVDIPDVQFKIETPEGWRTIRNSDEKIEPAKAAPAH